MDHDDPISQFFPDQEDVDLYAVLSLDKTAKADEIKKSYRRLALLFHPDKHATSSQELRADASGKFQQIGFAYAVLSDDKRRARYDQTGRTDEGFELQADDDGWESYFADLFDRVTKGKLDEMKTEYQGSEEEVEDLKRAYMETDGSLGEIMTHIPHCTHDDEARFVDIVTKLIERGDLPSLRSWKSSVKDEKARIVRQKQREREAKEAEAHAKELGVWDEFYGSGKAGPRKRKGKAAETGAGNEDDHSALQALILGKRKKMDGFFDNLAAKYAEPEAPAKGRKGKKRAKTKDEASEKTWVGQPDIDEAEFGELQKKLFGDKARAATGGGQGGKAKVKGKAVP